MLSYTDALVTHRSSVTDWTQLAALATLLALLNACSTPSESATGQACDLPSARVMTDITASQPLPSEVGPCIGLEDYDNDGHADLLVASGRPDGSYRLAVHPGKGKAKFDYPEPILEDSTTPIACTSGDLDGDGLIDIILGRSPAAVEIWRNTGSRRFELVPDAMPTLSIVDMLIFSLTVFDYDRDGDLDLLVGRSVQEPNPDPAKECTTDGLDYACPPFGEPKSAPPLLIENTTEEWVLHPEAFSEPWPGMTHAVTLVDINDDGYIDVFTSDDFSENHLYLNEAGSGSFSESASSYGLGGYNHGMGAAIADFDGDGLRDLYSADLGSDRFFFGIGDGAKPEDRAGPLGIADQTALTSSWAPLARDFDHDGVLDLLVVNSATVDNREDLRKVALASYVSDPPPQRDYLFYSAGRDTRETLELPHTKAKEATVVYGMSAAGDLDDDGDLDLVIAASYPPALRVLRNDQQGGGRHLFVELEGSGSNTAAIGATVRVERKSGAIVEASVLSHGAGALAGSPRRLHFGLCHDTEVAGIEVLWPSGAQQQLSGPIETGQILRLSEGAD